MFVFHRPWLKLITMLCLMALTASYFLIFSLVLEKRPRRFHPSSKHLDNRSAPPWPHPPLWPRPSPCTCYPGAVTLKNYFPEEEIQQVELRRAAEFKKYKLRNPSVLTTPLFVRSNSPLRFPIQGFTLRPLTSALIPGLGVFAEKRSSYKVSLKASIGVLSSNISHEDATVTGGGTTTFTVESGSRTTLNLLLAHVVYTSTTYHVNTADLLSFQFEDHEAVFPVSIRQLQLPILWDHDDDINSQVTITIKTFERYQKLNLLLESIRRFYPHIPVIIADDSFKPQTVSGDNIEQHIMPPGRGWFAGRSLAVSQVTTKYFLWVDDDFLFTEKTKIHKFLEVMEKNPQLDVVGGSVLGSRFQFSIFYEDGDSEGGCMHMRMGRRFRKLPGFPKCSLANGVVNLFLARTDSMQKAGFDPKLQRIGHPEVFMDGLGFLTIATCNDPASMSIDHQIHAGNGYNYNKFRYLANYNRKVRFPLFYFKHNLKCLKFL